MTDTSTKTSKRTISPPKPFQVAVSVDWNDATKTVPEYAVWVIPVDAPCPSGKRSFRIVDSKFGACGLICECYAQVIQ